MTQDVQALGVGGHQAVLDAVVDHLDEVAGAAGAAVQVALLGGAAGRLAARRAGAAPMPGASAAKIGSSRRTGAPLAADHQAVAALEAPDAAAGAHVQVVDALAVSVRRRGGCRRGRRSCRRRSPRRRDRAAARGRRASDRPRPPAPSSRRAGAGSSRATKSSSDVAPIAPSRAATRPPRRGRRRRRRRGRPRAAAAPCWPPSAPSRSCRVAWFCSPRADFHAP